MSITENIIIWHISFSVKPEWISWGQLVKNDYMLFLINLLRFFIASLLSCTLWLGSGQECQNIVVEWLSVTGMAYCGWSVSSDSDCVLWLSG